MSDVTNQLTQFGAISSTADGVARALVEWKESEREEALHHVASLERQLGYGIPGKPTTAQIRAWYRKYAYSCKTCPHCGKYIAVAVDIAVDI
jgi:hypothetical protein